MQPLSGIQRPDLLTSLMNMSLVLRLPRKMHLCRSSSNVPHLPTLLKLLQNPHVLFTFDKVHNLNVQKWSRHGVICAFRKCASRQHGVHFFDMSTSKSAPKMVSLVHILTWKCASCHNSLHFFDSKSAASMRCLCILTWKVLRARGVLYILSWKYASRHNGVQVSISHLASWLHTRRFSEPSFRPSGATNHWKNIVICDFSTFSRAWIFFLLTLSLLWSSLFFSSLLLWLFPPLLFHRSILSEVWLPNFLR